MIINGIEWDYENEGGSTSVPNQTKILPGRTYRVRANIVGSVEWHTVVRRPLDAKLNILLFSKEESYDAWKRVNDELIVEAHKADAKGTARPTREEAKERYGKALKEANDSNQSRLTPDRAVAGLAHGRDNTPHADNGGNRHE